MMLAAPPAYSSLPNMPSVNALPGGVPFGPWGKLYRSAPGAQLPAVHYPGMRGAGVTIQGFGQTNGTAGTLGRLLLAAGISAAVAAAFAMARDSSRPVLNPALVMGGITFGTGVLAIAATQKAAAAPAEQPAG
jgi:hypothetical protein